MIRLDDDGTLHVDSLRILIPLYWEQTEQLGVYRCLLPPCQRRRFSYRVRDGKLQVRFHCLLHRRDVTGEECQLCKDAFVAKSRAQELEIQEVDGTVTRAQGRIVEVDDPSIAVTWVVESIQPVSERLDLLAIEQTLPETQERVRKVRIESDGSIVYEQEEGEWEPPRDINGYQRDLTNPWRFVPLWPKCMERIPKGNRTKSCGCIQVTMKCQHRDSELCGTEVTHEQCQQCPVREPQRETQP